METLKAFDSDKIMSNGFNITNSLIINEAAEGSEDKFFIEYNNKKYLVKDSSFNKRRKQNSLAPYCEYVGSHFMNELGLNCQKTFLGFYQNKPVVICEDVFGDYTFRPFRDLHQSSVDSNLENKEYTYDDVIYVMTKIHNITGEELQNSLDTFWKMFLGDAILGNRDRHEGNWGFLVIDGKLKFSPIFDNGSSLFPDVNLANWKTESFIKQRVFQIPGSQFKMWRANITDRPMRTNYWQVINDASINENFVKNIENLKDFKILDAIEKSTVDVPPKYTEWFSCILYCRFYCLILHEKFDTVFEKARLLYDI